MKMLYPTHDQLLLQLQKEQNRNDDLYRGLERTTDLLKLALASMTDERAKRHVQSGIDFCLALLGKAGTDDD